ncbi:MAG: hypothetical protein GY853_00625 [PVC group bacterium]|nr:hypothetical protein [PVC group bacterium]
MNIQQILTSEINQIIKSDFISAKNKVLKEMKEYSDLHELWETTHGGKLGPYGNFPALKSISVKLGKFCNNMRKNCKTICSECYAVDMLSYRAELNKRLENNYRLLTTSIIPRKNLPVITDKRFRFNSFGELENMIHLENYLEICRKNPETSFTLWTKRVDLVRKIKDKPENLILIYSNPLLNDVSIQKPKMFDKMFTVYTKKGIKEHDLDVNCLMKCNNCHKCYTKNNITQINEVLK